MAADYYNLDSIFTKVKMRTDIDPRAYMLNANYNFVLPSSAFIRLPSSFHEYMALISLPTSSS